MLQYIYIYYSYSTYILVYLHVKWWQKYPFKQISTSIIFLLEELYLKNIEYIKKYTNNYQPYNAYLYFKMHVHNKKIIKIFDLDFLFFKCYLFA